MLEGQAWVWARVDDFYEDESSWSGSYSVELLDGQKRCVAIPRNQRSADARTRWRHCATVLRGLCVASFACVARAFACVARAIAFVTRAAVVRRGLCPLLTFHALSVSNRYYLETGDLRQVQRRLAGG